MNYDVRLKLLKALVNIPARVLDRFLPEKKPKYPQTILLDKMFQRMFTAYELDVYNGAFRERNNIAGDGNFPRLLHVTHKLLTLIAEDDRYYREWIGLAILLARDEYNRWLQAITARYIKFWCQAQWYVSPECLSDRAVEEAKEQLAPDVLAYYLFYLSNQKNKK